MLTFFGARERTLREWKDVVRRADHRFEVHYRDSAREHQGDILDVVWNSRKRDSEGGDGKADGESAQLSGNGEAIH